MLLVYFPIAGRGELARLIAKVGGIEDFSESTELPSGVTKAQCGSAGSVPILIDGDLKMNESSAIEIYLASIAPKYASLTPKQRAKDAQFCLLKETCCVGMATPLFEGKDKEKIQANADKYFPVLEEILPEDGFVNGLDYPTVADLAILNICEAYMPFKACYKYGEVDLAAKYPKLVAHAEKVKAVEDIAKVVSESATMSAGAFGF
eukprot:CAMPEP_0113544146 /NCGR_PEP_ID=MMETSP0015_2-20120614/10550_1 /TAXON_ID=2838 /ORGANISM="Odontella" /LENGTH=205 /DNA_ID=CAMNT_0000444381 /DNA_START=103 /DNA_END=720 /DNA_ORIENTATION=- /assembly_acc=CAM_ASM_000160